MDVAALFLSRLLPLLITTAIVGAAPLDPQQLLTLRALGLGAHPRADPCGAGATVGAALAPSLRALAFSDCPATPPRALPLEQLASGLQAFSCTASLHSLSAVWLSHLTNLPELTVADTPLATGSPTELAVVVSHMERLTRLTISNANLSGFLPHHWHCPNLTHLDLSGNRITGAIPDTLTLLAGITHINLSSNVLNGPIPTSIGDLISLTALDLSNNTISGGIPDTLSTLPELEVPNLGSNRLNGSILLFLAEMRGLRGSTWRTTTSTAWCRSPPSSCPGCACSGPPGTASCATTGRGRGAVRQVRVPGAAAPCHGAVGAKRGLRRRRWGQRGGRRRRHEGWTQRDGARVAIGLSCLAFLVILLVCICKVCR
ncbi:unnamed protein product [Miscanthus lutarioriparius]|uniref:Uncharacterized protein n=1 Tax=Miscanthus lutarioriparius TaxID=422564 RepID=A0A811P9S1_9POAL|nr:unnamed protein product [Miscanthus lutarioriparius]